MANNHDHEGSDERDEGKAKRRWLRIAAYVSSDVLRGFIRGVSSFVAHHIIEAMFN
jgi:hypothetical protein